MRDPVDHGLRFGDIQRIRRIPQLNFQFRIGKRSYLGRAFFHGLDLLAGRRDLRIILNRFLDKWAKL